MFEHLLASGARRDAAAAEAALREVLPIRLAERWLELHPLKKWTNAALEEAERALHHFDFVPSGTEGFAQGRGDGGRSGHQRAFGTDDGVEEGSGAVLCGRGGGCDRAPGGIQLPVGLGFGVQRGAGGVSGQTR